MKLYEIPYNATLDFSKLSKLAYAGDILLFKNFLSPEQATTLKKELVSWRNQSPPYTSEEPYPKDLLNLHLELKNSPLDKDPQHLDYSETNTSFTMYNYRIGNMNDPFIHKQIPSFQQTGNHILNLFDNISNNPLLIHGSKNPHNLYFEIAQFPCGAGHIEPHTHQTIFNFGQKLNMVTALSEPLKNYASGGLFIQNGDTVLDLTTNFTFTDTIFFRNDVIHWVNEITGNQDEHFNELGGRWSLTMFYY